MLGYVMDPRTGLGRFKEFQISNYQLMEKLINLCRTQNIKQILQDPDIQERMEVYNEHFALFIDMLRIHSYTNGNVIITDLRGVDTIFSGNRFTVYALFPNQNISIWVVDGRDKKNCSIAVGYSIVNRTSTVNVAHILLSYGGGGHNTVGTCQINYDDCDRVIGELIEKLQ
jgi:nanoRNase/pAp phosphatase (c-di-AMP/oligoRNAs hydrolase)